VQTPTWYVYILECADKSLYTGVTIDCERREREHNEHARLGARYTRSRRPVRMIWHHACLNRSQAMRFEYWIKRLSRADKQRLLGGGCVQALLPQVTS